MIVKTMKDVTAGALSVLALLLACAAPPDHDSSGTEGVDPVTAGGSDVSWSYSGDTAPAFWGSLREAYRLCAEGRKQSPVDLAAETAVAEKLPDILFEYRAARLNLERDRFTFKAELDATSRITLEGTSFDLVQYHVHTPSEHTLEGLNTPMELHLVHASAAGERTVVGVMVELGEENLALGTVLENVPAALGGVVAVEGVEINPADFLPAARASFRYSGSLTTPGCEEPIRWNVLASPITISQSQLDAYHRLFPVGTNRPVQPLHGRPVLSDSGG